MALKTYNPVTPSQRQLVLVDHAGLYRGAPVKALTEGKNSTGGRGFALEYARRGARVWALWYASETAFDAQGPVAQEGGQGRTPTVRVPVSRGRVAAFDYLGRSRPVRRRGGRVTLALGPAPVYLVSAGP